MRGLDDWLAGTHREPGQAEGLEGGPATETTIRYHKACSCEGATASGPRIYNAGVRQVADLTQFTFGTAAMVCDECDTPWKREEEEPRR